MAKFEKIDLGLKEAYEELFMTDKCREEFRAPKVMDIEISKIDDFENHPPSNSPLVICLMRFPPAE